MHIFNTIYAHIQVDLYAHIQHNICTWYKFYISNELLRVLIGQLTSKSDTLFTT
jgi:hypothetical protein